MSKAWMPLYVADYLADTRHLSTEEHGAYLLLIMHYWQTGKPIPADEKIIRAITGIHHANQHTKSLLLHITFLFTLHEGFYYHKRIDAELAKNSEICNKRKELGIQGAKKRWGNNGTEEDSNSHSKRDSKTIALSQSQSQSQEKKKKKNKEPKKIATAIPLTFSISPSVRSWAEKNGYQYLEERMDYFKDYAKANDKRYTDWDAAFRNCIKGDWGNISKIMKQKHTEDDTSWTPD